jgi:Leucine-rich repeat (LRR) protein
MQPLQASYKKNKSKLPMPSIILALLLLISSASPTSSCTEKEKTYLLQFLTGLSHDAGLAMSWQGSDCCKWEGITCNQNGTVIKVSLPSKGLEGHISRSLENLTGLQHLNLSYNSMYGGLPWELVSSSSIMVLDVSFNQLNGDLHEMSYSTPGQPLQVLDISSNLFTGHFTSVTWKEMENLITLNASNNSFTGQIPTHFCNISPSFAVLELGYNHFSGIVPSGLGNCSMLKVLKADHNNLSETLPDELFNATSLEYLSFANNNLHGSLDATQIINLRYLETLDLGGNNFTGMIPDSIGQLSRLKELHLDHNNMSGELPSSLASCPNLRTIDLKSNNFSGELAKVIKVGRFLNSPGGRASRVAYSSPFIKWAGLTRCV